MFYLFFEMVMDEVRRVTEGQEWISNSYAIDTWEPNKDTLGSKLQSSYSV
jgi:hypothetical protein